MNSITVQQLKERLDNGEAINLIDCREPAEYEEYNIGGTLIPLGNIQQMDLRPLEGKEEEEIIIHCRSGKRSAAACQYLDSIGFKNTVNVEGGAMAWKDAFDNQ
ncbi:MAG TPA: rhodanese-like domain-containing protein [Niabella sp.]|nr:rhodanese-like domain-containing protein [Niabella sp.]HOZ97827.1 rhodanese-like domain-containing protein [Niabella sp.]HQW15666.1 rhodanese-like domain-containing protein [Niabella sp.]HQX20817.1 rhodanese-like domain-containing protein [Niabella sp.]HQX41402.1 rhodanese-like domain-containing protein [Niabella sp.]